MWFREDERGDIVVKSEWWDAVVDKKGVLYVYKEAKIAAKRVIILDFVIARYFKYWNVKRMGLIFINIK